MYYTGDRYANQSLDGSLQCISQCILSSSCFVSHNAYLCHATCKMFSLSVQFFQFFDIKLSMENRSVDFKWIFEDLDKYYSTIVIFNCVACEKALGLCVSHIFIFSAAQHFCNLIPLFLYFTARHSLSRAFMFLLCPASFFAILCFCFQLFFFFVFLFN